MGDGKKPAEAGRLGTSLAAALAARGVSVSAPAAAPASPPLAHAAKVVVRRERKGRGGKTATVVTGLGLRAADLERTARELKRSFGCGATVEGETIVLQGDLAARVEPWLAARGARKIVIGN